MFFNFFKKRKTEEYFKEGIDNGIKITSEMFKNISIRGRVAYGIRCLENALFHYAFEGEGWTILLKKMWEFTSLSAAFNIKKGELFIEKWLEVSHYLPYTDSYFAKTATYADCCLALESEKEVPPSEQEYNALKHDFNINSNDVLVKICANIFDIGTNDMWAGIDKVSKNTLKPLQNVIDLMHKNNIFLPPVAPLLNYVFSKKEWDHVLHGWGEPFNAKLFTRIFDNGENIINELSRYAEKYLIKWGWYPGRKVDISEYENALKKQGYAEIWQPLREFLTEFGGLYLQHPPLTVPTPDEIKKFPDFDRWEKAYFNPIETDFRKEQVEEYEKRVGEELIAFGESDNGYIVLMMTPTGKIYGCYDNYLGKFGENYLDMFNKLYHRIRPEEIK